MVDKNELKKVYLQNLETSIIEYLAEKLKIDLRDAMDIYYESNLAKQISESAYGIENLDYKNLAENLIETE